MQGGGGQGGNSSARKWSFSGLLSAVQSATPTLPRVNVRRNLNVVSAWFSAQAGGGGGRGGSGVEDEEEEENGLTAQEGMEEQIDQSTLITDGLYDVDHLDFTRSALHTRRCALTRLLLFGSGCSSDLPSCVCVCVLCVRAVRGWCAQGAAS